MSKGGPGLLRPLETRRRREAPAWQVWGNNVLMPQRGGNNVQVNPPAPVSLARFFIYASQPSAAPTYCPEPKLEDLSDAPPPDPEQLQ